MENTYFKIETIKSEDNYIVRAKGLDKEEVHFNLVKTVSDIVDDSEVYFRYYPCVESEVEFDTKLKWYKGYARFTLISREDAQQI